MTIRLCNHRRSCPSGGLLVAMPIVRTGGQGSDTPSIWRHRFDGRAVRVIWNLRGITVRQSCCSASGKKASPS
jgi:hypothetical protein